MTIGRILARGDFRGSGFVVAVGPGRSSRVAMTAEHVIRGCEEASLQFVTDSGRAVGVERAETDADLDVAVLYLAESVDGFAAARARDRLDWLVDSRPRPNDSRLTGIITDARRPFSKNHGPEFPVLQLLVNEELGGYKGYSGSPVLLATSDARPVLGVLFEQLLQRPGAGPAMKGQATNVLYAVPIADALTRFGLDAVWVPTGDEPSDADLAARYRQALTAQFDERHGRRPHVSLGLERGDRTPVAVPAALRREQDEMVALLGPRYAPVPPGETAAPDAGRPVDDLGDFLARHRRVVLLGRPGAGKSSTLRGLFTGLAGDDARLTIFADLSEWGDPAAGLLDFLQAQLRSLHQLTLAERLPGLMSAGRVVLLLDGLNEMPRLSRDPATGRLSDPRVEAITALAARPEWEENGCVLTCRPRDFDGGPAWHDVHLLDLDEDQTQALAEAYFREAPGSAAAFLTALGRARRLDQLAALPFFLVKLMGYFWVRRTLSDNLDEILTVTLVGALVREGGDAEEVRRQLGCLAFRMTAAGLFGSVDRQRAAEWLESDDATFWRIAEGADLVVTSPGEVRFTHQLIQEYFTADHLRGRPATAALVETVAQPQFNEVWPVWATGDPTLVDRLTPLLGDAAAGVRRATATILGALRDGRAAGPLAGMLTDSDPAVRWTCALGLAALRDSRATPVLIERLREAGNTAVQVSAVTALGETGDERALRPLVETLASASSGELSRATGRALGRLGDPRAVPDLIAALGEREARDGAVGALLAMGEAALDPLIEALRHDRNGRRRANAAFVLGLSHRPRAIPPLIAALADDERTVQDYSASALGYFGEPALGPLIDALSDGDEDVRTWALRALAYMRDPRAVPHLLHAMVSDSADVAEQAARCLRICGEGAVEPLADLLFHHADPDMRWNAATALSGLGEPGITALVAAADSDDPATRVCAIAGLGEAATSLSVLEPPDPRLAVSLNDALYDIDPAVRDIAAIGLGRSGDARAVNTLAAMVRSGEPEARALAVEQLGHIEDPAAVDALVTALRVADAEVRRAACEALGRLLHEPRSVQEAAEAAIAGMPSPPGTALIEVLTAWRDPSAAPPLVAGLRRAALPLIEALGDPDSEVADAAAPAVARAAQPLVTLASILPGDGPAGTDDEACRLHSLVREVLVPLSGPDTVSALLAALGPLDDASDDRWEPLRAVIASVLGSLADKRAVPALIELLGSSNRDVVVSASAALTELGGPEALPAILDRITGVTRTRPDQLSPLMRDILTLADDRTPALLLETMRGADGYVADDLANLLNALGERALVPLVTALPEAGPGMARHIAAALDPRSLGSVIVDDVPWRSMIDALDLLSDRDVDILVTAAGHADEDVARVAVALLERLGRTGDRSVADRQVPLLDDPVPPVVHRAAGASAVLGGADSLRALLGALGEDATRANAAESIGEFNDDTYRDVGLDTLAETLLAAVRHERRFEKDHGARTVYTAARKVLTKLGTPARTLLLEALDDDHDAVRHLAARVLGEGADLRALPVLEWMAEHDPGEYVSGGGKPQHAAGTARDLIQDAYRAREPLIECLTSGDRLLRFGAAFRLSSLEWRGATPALIEALRDDDPRIRWGAARRLGSSRDERAVAPLVASLGDPDHLARDAVAEAVIAFGPAAMPVVLPVLDDPAPGARAQAARIVGHSGGSGDVARLAAALDDASVGVIMAAAGALTRLADREVTGDADGAGIGAALNRAFRTVEEKGRGGFDQWSIIDALERFDPAGAADVLIEATRSSRRDSRLVAVKRLGELGDRRAIDALHQALSDEEWTVREDAADSLRSFADPSSVGPLLGLLSRDTGFTCLAAIETLAEIADPRAAAPMVAQLRSQHDRIRAEAEDTIVALADDAAIAALVTLLGEELPDWFAYDADAVDPPGMNALVRLGPRAAGPLVEALGDPVRGERAAETLRRMGAVAVPALVDGLRAPVDDGPAETCATVLAGLGEPGWSALAAALTDGRPGVRVGAAYGLWCAEGKATVPALVTALSDAVAEVRCYATLALGGLGELSVTAPVAALADDPDPEVRVCAAATLARLGDDRAVPLFRAALATDGEPARLATWLIGLYDIDAGVEPEILHHDDEDMP
ncbi:HEAT repeat domain-containing protein [Nucisporomicrobium flavum]|uniref:HEAT repeat domain-containing protein n=1 Tax=Nucisporomicrobium flavum TaxID=2785915 RepID=UPI0018F47284|nr:HEAT repeat domain-containing protein [Nucisporomicrobium flavum]